MIGRSQPKRDASIGERRAQAGGEGGIRTLDPPEADTRFPSVRTRPLCDLSLKAGTEYNIESVSATEKLNNIKKSSDESGAARGAKP